MQTPYHEKDPHYPTYHLRTPDGAVNDPCGLLRRGGEYQLFYQWTARWIHTVSGDLVHWRHLPIALEATPGSCDEGGSWSGSVSDAGGTPVILYTGVDIPPLERSREWRQVQCLATVPLDQVDDCIELVAEFAPGEAEEFGLSLRRPPDDSTHGPWQRPHIRKVSRLAIPDLHRSLP